MKPFAYAILVLSLAPASYTAQADELLMERGAELRAPGPSNGIPMERVRDRFGEPGERLAPVGDPPITRWVYGDFTVYFEYDRVITSVAHD